MLKFLAYGEKFPPFTDTCLPTGLRINPSGSSNITCQGLAAVCTSAAMCLTCPRATAFDQAEAGQLKMKKPPRQAERLSCVLSECDVTHTPLRRATPSSSLQRLPMGCRGRSLVALLGELHFCAKAPVSFRMPRPDVPVIDVSLLRKSGIDERLAVRCDPVCFPAVATFGRYRC